LAAAALLVVVVLAVQMEALEQTLFFLLLHQLAVVMAHGISKLEEAVVLVAAHLALPIQPLRLMLVVQETHQAQAQAKVMMVVLRHVLAVLVAVEQLEPELLLVLAVLVQRLP
jgi:hypothetical protein